VNVLPKIKGKEFCKGRPKKQKKRKGSKIIFPHSLRRHQKTMLPPHSPAHIKKRISLPHVPSLSKNKKEPKKSFITHHSHLPFHNH
jgi:hypothetical protein